MCFVLKRKLRLREEAYWLYKSGNGVTGGASDPEAKDLFQTLPLVNRLTLASPSMTSVLYFYHNQVIMDDLQRHLWYFRSLLLFLTLNFYQSRFYNMKRSNALKVWLAELRRWGSYVDKCHEVNIHCHNTDKEDNVLVTSFIQFNIKNRKRSPSHNNPHGSRSLIVQAVDIGKMQCGGYSEHFNLCLIKERDPGITPTRRTYKRPIEYY